jgi:hypothetical protein
MQNLRNCIYILVCFCITSSLFGFQPRDTSGYQSALGRRGLHHANITGRFLSAKGQPVKGVRVQLEAGGVRDLPIAETVSGADGRFGFADVQTVNSPGLRWYPSEEWLMGVIAVGGESGEDTDVGDIRLQPNTTIRIAVEVTGPSLATNRRPSVVLQGVGNGPRIVAQEIGGQLVLDQIPFGDGQWDISIYANNRSERFPGKFHVERGRRDQLLLLRLHRETVKRVNQYGDEGTLEVSEVLVPEQSIVSERHASGRLLDPEGNPVPNAIVAIAELPIIRRSIPAWTSTNAQGEFDLSYSSSQCASPSFAFGNPEGQLPDLGSREPCEQLWGAPRTVRAPDEVRLNLTINGDAASQARAFWFHPSRGWQRFDSLHPWLMGSNINDHTLVKVEAPGILPTIQELELPARNYARDAPQERKEIAATFTLDSRGNRDLLVLSAGQPLANAIVDLEWIKELDRDTRVPLAAYRTGTDGRLSLKGSGGQLVDAFVYSPGYEPARAIWEPGRPLRFELKPRDARLSILDAQKGSIVRARMIGQPGAVRTFRVNSREEEFPVSAGDYDITLYDPAGGVARQQRLTITAGKMARLDPATDERPTLVVRFPADGWSASVSDSTPSGMAVGFAIYSTAGVGYNIREAPAILQSEQPREAVFRLARAGAFHLDVRPPGQAPTWWREFSAAPGETITTNVPAPSATFSGSMRTYDGGTGFSEHGWAGPRIMLISDDSTGWSVTDFIPPRTGQNTFTMRGLPTGSFHVYQHLIARSQVYRNARGEESKYSVPVNAWGGIPVNLAAGQTTTLNDFIDFAFTDLDVKVTDSTGNSVTGATLRVRDRMSESWRQVAEGPTTLSNAAHPIPYPPAVRLNAAQATLPSIRAGWLELQVELDDGRVFPSIAHIEKPEDGVRLTLPESSR